MVSVFHYFTPVILDKLVLEDHHGIDSWWWWWGKQLICYPNLLQACMHFFILLDVTEPWKL